MLNVRLPEGLESRLAEEANRSQKSRSELVREAISAYLGECERRRIMQAMSLAAGAIAEGSAAQASRDMADDFLPLENEVAEGAGDYGDADDEGNGWWK